MKKLKKIRLILSIISAIVIIIATTFTLSDRVKEWSIFDSIEEDFPVDIILEPEYISEGQYDKFSGVDIKVIIPNLKKHNISSFELASSSIKVDRLNKNEQTKVSSIIRWTNPYNRNYLFYYSSPGNMPTGNLVAKGKLLDCPNCFMGKESPYRFTFVAQYVENGESKTKPLQVDVPIR